MRLSISNKKVSKLAPCVDLCNVPCFKEALVKQLKAELPSDESLEEARVLFAALADRTRLALDLALDLGVRPHASGRTVRV